jgi:hypothetical protein
MQFAEVIGGLVDRVRVNCQGQNPRVVAFGEMVSLLWEQGKPDAAIALERLWNDLAARGLIYVTNGDGLWIVKSKQKVEEEAIVDNYGG